MADMGGVTEIRKLLYLYDAGITPKNYLLSRVLFKTSLTLFRVCL